MAPAPPRALLLSNALYERKENDMKLSDLVQSNIPLSALVGTAVKNGAKR